MLKSKGLDSEHYVGNNFFHIMIAIEACLFQQQKQTAHFLWNSYHHASPGDLVNQ